MERFDEERLSRLRLAIDYSRRKLEPFRQRRMAALRQFVGSHYSDDGSSVPEPVNLLELATGVYVRQLVAKNPRVLIQTSYRGLKPRARLFELAANHMIEEIRLDETLRRVLMEAIFSVGIVKVGENISGAVEIGGYLHDVGQPYCDVVALDDFVVDLNARTWEEVAFIGNRYRMPLEDARSCGLFDPDVVKQLSATPRSAYNEFGDERAESLSVGTDSDPEEYCDYVELLDLWLPRENLFMTLAWDQENLRPLRVGPWQGPEWGPYLILSFCDVPGNLMPLPPVAVWMELHNVANAIYRKLVRQAERQKDITAAAPGSENDARPSSGAGRRRRRGPHQDRIKPVSYGGADVGTLQFGMHLRDLFVYHAGNLDLLGGLSPQSETLGQDQLLAENASLRLADMTDRVYRFVRQVMRSLCWYLWYDPLIEIPFTFRVAGLGIEVPMAFDATAREGDFLDYNIDIEPYSMQHESPGRRLSKVMEVVNGVIAPFAPFMAEQGIAPDFEGILRIIARYANMPELEELVQIQAPRQPEPGMIRPQPVVKPAVTTRRYERVSRAGATRGARDYLAMQNLAAVAAAGRNSQTVGVA
ncbi:hypothetical protein HS125_04565 [bacterium]|nr:hypothetical protein [bacterium]